MTNRTFAGIAIGAAVLAGASAALAQVAARVPQRGTSEQLQQLASKPTPKLADGRIDFNGTWDHLGGIEFVRPQTRPDGSVCFIACPPAAGAARAAGQGPRAGGPPPAPFPPVQTDFPKYKPEFQAKVKELTGQQVKFDTVLQCQPPGVPRIGPPAKIMQNAREVVFLYDDVNGSFFRIIPIDGRSYRKDVPASYLGDSIGRIEGDTLIIETTNFRTDDGTVYQGANPETYKITERFTRVEDDTINYEFTINDPTTWTKPWTAVIPWSKIDPKEQMYEYMCHEDNFDIVHLLTGARNREKNPSLNLQPAKR